MRSIRMVLKTSTGTQIVLIEVWVSPAMFGGGGSPPHDFRIARMIETVNAKVNLMLDNACSLKYNSQYEQAKHSQTGSNPFGACRGLQPAVHQPHGRRVD